MNNSYKIQSGDKIYINCSLVTMDPSRDQSYGLLKDHALITRGEKIAAIIPQKEIQNSSGVVNIDLKGALITPSFIDCHTHLVFGGDRAAEWEMRLNGVSYTEIASKGGGINSTVRETRKASFEQLYEKAAKRLQALLNEGVSTIEAKSGYGLDLENERKQLEVIKQLQKDFKVDLSPTLLSAHSVPPEYAGKSDEYLNLVCDTIMPTLWKEGLFETVDIFCEKIAFNLEQTEKLFKAATNLGIPVKAHVEQLSDMGGSALVAKYNGRSIDHIEYLTEEGIKAVSNQDTVAVLLPLAFYFLKETKVPPIDLLRKYKVPMAISTDFNPGTSPFASIRMAMNVACTMFALTPSEAMAGVTRNAAQALGRANSQGQLKAGYLANLSVWDVDEPVNIFYELGQNPLVQRIYKGETI